ncbi:MAG: hypothetical protein M5R36_12605 [Deltaproteobacteria bacterium]|nr:hypothetical protein [Deltaproteobacteria bacterium]
MAWQRALDDPSSVNEYWIFRSDLNDPFTFNEEMPVARVKTSDAESCTGVIDSLLAAERACYNKPFYRWGNYYVWRDQPNAPGRTLAVGPVDGMAFGLPDGGYGATGTSPTGSGFVAANMHIYNYKVKSYRQADQCTSRGTVFASDCGHYFNTQSFNAYDGAAVAPGRFSPPWDFRVQNASSHDDFNGTTFPALRSSGTRRRRSFAKARPRRTTIFPI